MLRSIRWTWHYILCMYVYVYRVHCLAFGVVERCWRKMLNVPRGRLLVVVICYWALRHSGSWMLVNGEIWCVDYPFPFWHPPPPSSWHTLSLSPHLSLFHHLSLPLSLPNQYPSENLSTKYFIRGCSFFTFYRKLI